MINNNSKFVSRRSWLGLMATATLSSGLPVITPKPFGSSLYQTDGNSGTHVYNICDFGAKGDGQTLNTAAVQDAIDTCYKDQGGTVLVPAGVFVIGTVEMKSNVTLHLSAAATLLGSADGKQYHAADAIPLHGDSTLGDGNVGLIFAVKADNITIEGTGTIDGQGAQFRHGENGQPSPAGLSSHQRPYHLLFYQCNNLSVKDIFLKNSAYHSVRVIQCKYVKMEGLHIHGRVIYNNDGFHFISSQYVHVNNCDVQSQDDACALFGSCKYVTISNSSFSTRWSVFRFGGGEAENITVSNCIIYETYGCPIKLHCSPGSRFENFLFSDIVMKGVTGPIYIGLSDRRRSSDDTSDHPGVVRNISFNNIQATVVKPVQLPDTEYKSNPKPGEELSCIILNAYDKNYIENISFNNVKITFPGGGTSADAAREFPKVAGEYFQAGTPPAYALYARNVQRLTMQDVSFEMVQPDLRPAVILNHVKDAAINGLNAEGDKGAESVLRFINNEDVLLTATRLLIDATVFLAVEGTDNKNIKIDGGDIAKANDAIVFNNGAEKQSVKWRE